MDETLIKAHLYKKEEGEYDKCIKFMKGPN